MLSVISDIKIQHLPETHQGCNVSIARFDLIDPMISGNKLYKLHYFVEAALEQGLNNIVTAGGAYSNHLAATAAYCKQVGIGCTGIVRGEMNEKTPSPTLQFCMSQGMKLVFVARQLYSKMDATIAADIIGLPADTFVYIPEGGYNPLGAAGASIMADKISHLSPTHVCMAVGTATTLAGFCLNSKLQAAIIGIPVLKNMKDIGTRLEFISNGRPYQEPTIVDGYHFGGYARHQPELLSFMNNLYEDSGVPTDFVYTGKMMFAVFDLLSKEYFPEKSRIVCIHTGGLQGNKSLPKSVLNF